MSFKLEYPINTKKSAFLQTITFSICTRTKMTVLNVIKNDTIRVFFAFRLFYRNHRCKPKFDIHSKIQSLLYLKSYFFVLIRFPGRAAAAFCYSASWPCLDFKNHDCIACCMYSHSDLPCKVRTCCDFQWSFSRSQSKKPNSQTKYISLLASLRKCTLIYCHA